jgi:hypothetical protein
VVHGAIMGVQAFSDSAERGHLITPSSYRTCTDYSLPVSRRTAKDSGHYRV